MCPVPAAATPPQRRSCAAAKESLRMLCQPVARTAEQQRGRGAFGDQASCYRAKPNAPCSRPTLEMAFQEIFVFRWGSAWTRRIRILQ